jgi:hypothetical protein
VPDVENVDALLGLDYLVVDLEWRVKKYTKFRV